MALPRRAAAWTPARGRSMRTGRWASAPPAEHTVPLTRMPVPDASCTSAHPPSAAAKASMRPAAALMRRCAKRWGIGSRRRLGEGGYEVARCTGVLFTLRTAPWPGLARTATGHRPKIRFRRASALPRQGRLEP